MGLFGKKKKSEDVEKKEEAPMSPNRNQLKAPSATPFGGGGASPFGKGGGSPFGGGASPSGSNTFAPKINGFGANFKK